MSGGNRKHKTVTIDRDALRDARLKAHQHERHGIKGGLVTLAVLAAAGACLYVYRDAKQQQSETPLSIAQNPHLQEPPVPAEPVGITEESALYAEPDAPAEATAVVQVPVQPVHAEPQPRQDHLSPEWLTPASRKVFLQIGRLDGYPENAASPFTGEFGQETISGSVVRINADQVRTEFPQSIMPGQSIVLNLPELERRNLLFRALSVRRDPPGTMLDPTKEVPSLRILCNGNTVWGRRLDRQGLMINALIPATYLESYKNTIALQNNGKLPVVFDALWIESARESSEPVRFAIRDWHQIPEAYQGQFAWNRERESELRVPRIPTNHDPFLQDPMQRFEASIRRDEKNTERLQGLWHYMNYFPGIHEQEKVAQLFLEKAVGWYFHGGSALTIENVSGPGRFFCAQTRRLYPSAHVLWLFSRVFEGETRRLPVNVLASGGTEQPLEQVYWMATENKPGVASIIIARSRFGRTPGGKVRVVCALPWRGTTAVSTHNGVFPEFVNIGKPTNRALFRDGKREDEPSGSYDRNRDDKAFNIRIAPNGQGGLLDIELDIQDSLYIRLVKEGTGTIERPAASLAGVAKPLDAPVLIEMAGGVTESRESSLLRRKHLPVFPAVFQALSGNYRIRIGNATRGSVQGVEYVVPEDAQSLFCEIDYTRGLPRTAEGAALALYSFHENIQNKHLSFWVYPHAKTTSRSIILRMALGAWEGRATLKPGKWQRVELQFADMTGERERQLVFMGPPDYDRPGRSDTITFEFNGIKLLDPAGSGGRYMDVRTLADGRQAIVVLGVPGQAGTARHHFPKAIAINTVTNMVAPDAASTFKWVYKSESQTLDLTGLQFPATTDASILPYLNYNEKQHCQQGLTPVVLIAEIDT